MIKAKPVMTAAQERKARRDMRNKARRNGDPMGLLNVSPHKVKGTSKGADMLLAANVRARNKFNKLAHFNGVIDAKGDAAIAARQAKKNMNEQWFNREPDAGDFFEPVLTARK